MRLPKQIESPHSTKEEIKRWRCIALLAECHSYVWCIDLK